MLITLLVAASPSLNRVLPTGRAPPPTMGGLTGLPRIPKRALALTKPWNPGGSYTEPIATLWRDLETLYGREDVAGLGGSRTYRDAGRSDKE